ncbi:UNVERIFIED_CONTAM: cyclopropane-fatty-acyl-phospholipid synthase, partial [Mumia flava]
VLAAALRRVPVRVRMPDGTELGRSRRDDPATARPEIELVRPDALFDRIADNPKIGIGEGYTAGDWRVADGTDLADALLPFAERVTTAVPPALRRLRRLVDRRLPRAQRGTPEGARRNIEAHYDLSNALFAAFLDSTMTYSSALFDREIPLADQSLAGAQRRKLDAVLDRAGVGAGTRVLEIGTGWGSLALRAAERGATVTTHTLSVEQAAAARERFEAAGVADRVDVRVEDYRSAEGHYDAIVSIEMIEAVGEEFWPVYFETLDRCLAPGGRVVVQAILMDDDRLVATRDSFGWIQKHIFPGGLIPSLPAIDRALGTTSLRVSEVHAFGPDYAETLRRWRSRFAAAWPHIRDLGFDEAFRRTWEFYLAYCEAGFAAGYLDVAQIRLERAA